MAIKKEFLLKLKTFESAVDGFYDLLNVNLGIIKDAILKDGVKNGQIQKFEYCTELSWKIVKKFLYEHDGIDTKSPKEACKEFFLAGHVKNKDYETLIKMLDDRNFLSHVYSEDDFATVLEKLPGYLKLMQKIGKVIRGKIS